MCVTHHDHHRNDMRYVSIRAINTWIKKNGMSRLGEPSRGCRNGNGCGRRTAMHGKIYGKNEICIYMHVGKKTWNRKNPRTDV